MRDDLQHYMPSVYRANYTGSAWVMPPYGLAMVGPVLRHLAYQNPHDRPKVQVGPVSIVALGATPVLGANGQKALENIGIFAETSDRFDPRRCGRVVTGGWMPMLCQINGYADGRGLELGDVVGAYPRVNPIEIPRWGAIRGYPQFTFLGQLSDEDFGRNASSPYSEQGGDNRLCLVTPRLISQVGWALCRLDAELTDGTASVPGTLLATSGDFYLSPGTSVKLFNSTNTFTAPAGNFCLAFPRTFGWANRDDNEMEILVLPCDTNSVLDPYVNTNPPAPP